MRLLNLLAVACLALPGVAVANPAVMALVTPSPLGVVLTVGHWIMTRDKPTYYIEVEGRGRSPEEARSNGYRLAVEQAVGSLISSETEVQNSQIRRDEIIAYASGYVTRFEVTSTTMSSTGEYRVKMKVWVGRSALADRLLNRSAQSGQVDGATASVQLQTLNHERVTGDRLLQQVLNDFPKRAFDIEMSPTDVVRQNRAANLEVSFKLRWNQDYLRSLWTALEATSQRANNTVSLVAVNSGGWFGFGGQARFDDMQRYRMVVSTFVLSEPAILVTLRGAGSDTVYRGCFYYQEMDHQPRYAVTTQRFVQVSNYEPKVYVDGSYRMRSSVQIPVTMQQLQQVSSIEMDVIPGKQCPNR